ncbi:hypothetical protein [Sphingopyxis panaciterrae]
MTLMIILGAIAGLYLVALLFRLASIALPLYAGIGAGFWLLDRDYGYGPSIAAAVATGAVVLFAGRMLCATLPPIFRGLVALAFALPAGFAGYQAARGLGGLALADGAVLTAVGVLGALAAAAAAWRSLTAPPMDHPEQGIPAGLSSKI